MYKFIRDKTEPLKMVHKKYKLPPQTPNQKEYNLEL